MCLNMEQPTVSFIVPVYNVEKYLNQCIHSLISQTFKNFEIVLVDDGSKDESSVLCDDWAKKDSRIKVYHKSNGGLSDARNYGLERARGEFVVFVDSDDFWIGNDSLTKLMSIRQQYPEADFIGFNCSYYYSDTNKYKQWVRYSDTLGTLTDKDIAVSELVKSGTVPMSAWSKLISRKFLLENNLEFIKGIKSEDIPWFIDLLDKCDNCLFINQYIYGYRQNVPGSITNTFDERNFNDLFNTIKKEIETIDSRTFSFEAKQALYSFLAYEWCILLAELKSLPKDLQIAKRQGLVQYKWLLRYTKNPKVRLTSFINKLFGLNLTETILRFYLISWKK